MGYIVRIHTLTRTHSHTDTRHVYRKQIKCIFPGRIKPTDREFEDIAAKQTRHRLINCCYHFNAVALQNDQQNHNVYKHV